MKNLLVPFLCAVLLCVGACDDTTINPKDDKKDTTVTSKTSITEDIVFILPEQDSAGKFFDNLYAINMDGSGLREIRSFPQGSSVALSPDGTKIIVKNDIIGNTKMYITDVDSDNVKLISPSARYGEWLPDNKSILYCEN